MMKPQLLAAPLTISAPLAIAALLLVCLLSACVAVHPVETPSSATAVATAAPAATETSAVTATGVSTATVATTATATVTSPSAEESAILVQDDFSDPASGWISQTTDYGEFGYENGEYRILLNKADFNTFSLLPKQSFGDVTVEADVTLMGGGPADGVFGLICRDNGEGSADYVFAIRGDGVYAILKRTSPTFWDAIATGKPSNALKTGEATNHLAATCAGDKLSFAINGKTLVETTDPDFTSGQVGMAVTTQPRSPALAVHFDNFVVRAATP